MYSHRMRRAVCIGIACCSPMGRWALANHGYGSASHYMMRRRWGYFVRWLMGAEPPKEYAIGAANR